MEQDLREIVKPQSQIDPSFKTERLYTRLSAAEVRRQLIESLDEREQVIAALEQAGWVQAKAARLLNMTPRQIAYRVKILNIRMKHI